MYVCIYIYIYTCIHTLMCMCVYIYIYIHTYIHTYFPSPAHPCLAAASVTPARFNNNDNDKHIDNSNNDKNTH